MSAAAAWSALLLAASALTPAEERGQGLYLHGTGASGRVVTAVVGDTAVAVPMPCAGCHGAEGQGGEEGGVRAPAIRWDVLSHPAGARAAYDSRRVIRAVAMGLDSNGRVLAAPMPRYQLQREDADNLVAFLRGLGTLRDPGISDGALVIGVLLPATPGARDAVRAAVEAWATSVNARGGVYTRRLELRFLDRPPADDPPFAFLGWGDDGVAQWMAEHEVPFLRATGGSERAFPFVFDLGPSPTDEVKRLNGYAARAGRAVLCLDAASLRAVPGDAVALVPSSLAWEAVAAAPPGGAIIAAHALPTDVDPAAAAAYHLAPARRADQWSFLAAARLMEEVLQRSGARLTRASFVTTLQATRRFATGFSPPVSFDADRSRGTDAVRLLRLDPRTGSLTPVE